MDKHAKILESTYFFLYMMGFMGASIMSASVPVLIRVFILGLTGEPGFPPDPIGACAMCGALFGAFIVIMCRYIVKVMDRILRPAIEKYWSIEKKEEVKRVLLKWMMIMWIIITAGVILLNVT